MAEAIYSERACALKTPNEDQTISTACAAIVAQRIERPRDGNGPATTATVDAADRQLLAPRLVTADAADGGEMPVDAAKGMLQRLAALGDSLVAIVDSEMIGVFVDRPSDTMLSDRPASFGLEPLA